MKGLQDQGLEIFAAYGNTPTDITAYANVGIPKERTWIVGPHGGKEGTQAIDYDHNNGFHSNIKDVWAQPNARIPVPYTSLDWGAPFWGYDK